MFQLKVDGVAFRFVPDPSQVANAIKVRACLTLKAMLKLYEELVFYILDEMNKVFMLRNHD